MNNMIVVSPRCTSDSAVWLAGELGLPYYDKEDFNGAVTPNTDPSKIINWGCSKLRGKVETFLLNKPGAVRRSLNKLTTFSLLSEHVKMPTMTQDKNEAISWATAGRKVVVRDRIKGSKGQGITITSDPAEVAELPAKFYTRFIAGCTEVRVNVYKGKVLTVYYKKPSGNDFRFKIQWEAENRLPAEISTMVSAVGEYIGLDMYGLDVLMTPKGKYFLLEVNSAPILFPITARRLAKAIKQEYTNV